MGDSKYILDSWKEKLDKFLTAAQNASKEVEEIHKCKREVQQIKEEIYNSVRSGYYLRDNNRIVISAPEIVIGNVDKDGILKDASSVIIRSNNIKVEGVGSSGSVAIRANTISNRTEDPGIDGLEAVVYDSANYSCRSGAITLDSTLTDGVFYRDGNGSSTGINLRSDTSISIDASLSIDESYGMKKTIEQRHDAVKKIAQDLQKIVNKQNTSINNAMDDIMKSLDTKDKWLLNDELTNANVESLDELIETVKEKFSSVVGQIRNHICALSELAEMKRREAALGNIKSNLKRASYYKEKSTGAWLTLNGESIIMSTRDGDGKLRENDSSGVLLDQIKNINVVAKDGKGALLKDSHVNIEAQDISLITNASKREDNDKTLHYDTAEGSVRVNSKNVVVTAYDYDVPEDGKKDADSQYKMKQLAAKGKITIGANSIDINSADQEGKAAGTVDINSKSIVLQAVNKTNDDGNGGGSNDKPKLTDGGTTKIFAKNINIGGEKLKDDAKAEKIIVTAKKVAAEGDEEADLMQGKDKKNYVMLKSNKLNAKNSDAQILESSKHDFSGNVNISKEAKIKTASIGDLTAKTSLKSPNQKDVGGAPLSVSTDKAAAPEIE